jgi:putative aminopeptidase
VTLKLQPSDFSLIQRLVETPGLPGRESLVVKVIQDALKVDNWETKVDPIGNLTAQKPGKGKKLLFIAHTDEVGLIVRRITPEGFLKVERLGGIGLQALPGSAFDLWTNEGRFDALVGCFAAHLENDSPEKTSLEDMYVDIGGTSKEEVLSWGVAVGDALTWKPDFCQLPGSRIRSKALDDRLGCFALIKLAHALSDTALDYDITLAFVVQEECMLYESAPIVNAFEPEIVIGIDGTLTFDTPDGSEPQCDIGLGKGPTIKLMDAIRGKTGYLPNWALTSNIIRFMEQSGFSYQREVVVNLSTALSLVPFMNSGLRTASLSLPIRYHHAPVEVADVKDLEVLINALQAMVLDGLF